MRLEGGTSTNDSKAFKATSMLDLYDEEGVEALAAYNAVSSGYVLLVESHLLKITDRRGEPKVNFSTFSNSAAIIVSESTFHRRAPMSHFDGATRQSNILLLEKSGSYDFKLLEEHPLCTSEEIAPGLAHYQVSFSVVANRGGPPSTQGWMLLIDLPQS